MRQQIIDLAVQYGFRTRWSDSVRFESAVGYIEIGRYVVGYAIGGAYWRAVGSVRRIATIPRQFLLVTVRCILHHT